MQRISGRARIKIQERLFPQRMSLLLCCAASSSKCRAWGTGVAIRHHLECSKGESQVHPVQEVRKPYTLLVLPSA